MLSGEPTHTALKGSNDITHSNNHLTVKYSLRIFVSYVQAIIQQKILYI